MSQSYGVSRRKLATVRSAIAVLALIACVGTARGATVFGNFEDNATDGFGALTNSGVVPWNTGTGGPGPANGTVITPASGPLAASKVLDLTGSASFNFGQSSGGALGYDFLANSLRPAFFANNTIEFDWEAVPNGGSAGFSQLYNIILNSQGGGFTNVDGYSTGNANMNQFYFTGYNGNLHHIVVNYQNYKNTILASGTPDGGNTLQFGIQPNAGGGAPGEMYFDNFQLTTTPEPSSFALIAIGVVGVLRRRRRSA